MREKPACCQQTQGHQELPLNFHHTQLEVFLLCSLVRGYKMWFILDAQDMY